ncbi:hypothetical protein GQ44DRAFT_761618 [Phaeosphaeriaceae sp. PMI808]|nr:hypothetical protein GQ44DRAFT_761618 [Phaeosphaeriaceae sp. PMI808]
MELCDSIGTSISSYQQNQLPETSTDTVVVFGNAIYLTVQYIPEIERQAWVSSCLDHLLLLKQLTFVEEGNTRRSKRRCGASQEGEPDAWDGCNRGIQARFIEGVDATEGIETTEGQARNQGNEVQARKRSQAKDDSVRGQENVDQPHPKRARVTF